jgi:hypothetical protein
LVELFSAIPDPGVNRQQRHVFAEVIVLTIVAFVANCNDWVAVERFGKARLPWLRTFLHFPRKPQLADHPEQSFGHFPE